MCKLAYIAKKGRAKLNIHRIIRSKSATLQIEGETVCIRDGGQWKECKEGHEPGDWVRQIEAAYEAKNRGRRAAPVSEAPHLLQKRQAPSSTTSNPSSTASSSSSASDSASAQPPPPPPPSGGQQGNTQQSAPLSVFVSSNIVSTVEISSGCLC